MSHSEPLERRQEPQSGIKRPRKENISFLRFICLVVRESKRAGGGERGRVSRRNRLPAAQGA